MPLIRLPTIVNASSARHDYPRLLPTIFLHKRNRVSIALGLPLNCFIHLGAILRAPLLYTATSALQFVNTSDVHSKIHDEDLGILPSTDNAPIV